MLSGLNGFKYLRAFKNKSMIGKSIKSSEYGFKKLMMVEIMETKKSLNILMASDITVNIGEIESIIFCDALVMELMIFVVKFDMFEISTFIDSTNFNSDKFKDMPSASNVNPLYKLINGFTMLGIVFCKAFCMLDETQLVRL